MAHARHGACTACGPELFELQLGHERRALHRPLGELLLRELDLRLRMSTHCLVGSAHKWESAELGVGLSGNRPQ
jgi:hypothetical protein